MYIGSDQSGPAIATSIVIVGSYLDMFASGCCNIYPLVDNTLSPMFVDQREKGL